MSKKAAIFVWLQYKALFSLCCSGFKVGKINCVFLKTGTLTISVSVNLSTECLCCLRSRVSVCFWAPSLSSRWSKQWRNEKSAGAPCWLFSPWQGGDITLFLNKPFFLWPKAQMLLLIFAHHSDTDAVFTPVQQKDRPTVRVSNMSEYETFNPANFRLKCSSKQYRRSTVTR